MAKLKPWYQVVTPRKDLCEGRPLDASEFAVHLDQIRDGRAHEDYQKPERFFERTFLTRSLLGLAAEVVRRLSGEKTETSAVFNMTTQFGGGKTHALTLLYHLANHGPAAQKWQGVPSILEKAGIKEIHKAATAVFVGTEFDSIQGRGGDDGTPLRKTPWGEIAFQLSGKEGFRVVEQHDKDFIAPGSDVIRKFLPKDKPCLILVDELMNYISRSRKIGLVGPLYNFLQNLSEEARGNDRMVLVASIPASELEMGPDDQSDYERLKKMLDRVGKPVIMSAESETSEIIRRRLFEWDHRAVNQEGRVLLSREAVDTCTAYADWISQYSDQMPSWFTEHSREAFLQTYPFHPAVLSVFERKWQGMPRFQQTRGVLRMLALWVSNAYQQGFKGLHKDPLIDQGVAPLDDERFRACVFEQLGESRLEGAVTADICGKKDSHAVRFDEEAVDAIKAARLHRKVAASVFFESNGGQGANRQHASVPEIRMSVGGPDLDIGHIETVLQTLLDGCYYLNADKNLFRFSLKENLNKRFSDRKASVRTEDVEKLVKEEIQKVFPPTEGIDRIFFPEKSSQIPDRPVITFVILSPEQSLQDSKNSRKSIEEMTREYGKSARTYKSALIWIVPESSGPLNEEAKKLIAWEDLSNEGLKLDDVQQRQLDTNVQKARRDLKESIWRAYKHLMFLGKDNNLRDDVDLGLVTSSAAESMCRFIILQLRQTDEIVKDYMPRTLVRNWPPAFVEWSTRSVRDAFFSSPQFPRLLHVDAIKETIARGVQEGHFAYVGKSPKGGYSPFLFKKPLSSLEVEISDDLFIISVEEAEKHIKPPELTRIVITPEQAKVIPKTKQTFIAQGLDQFSRDIACGKIEWSATGGKVMQDGVFEAGADEGRFVVQVKSGKVTGVAEVAVFYPDSASEPPIASSAGVLRWVGEIAPQKWMNFYTKVLSRFVKNGNLRIKVEFQSSAGEGVSKQQIEETKAALRELGLDDQIQEGKS